MAPNLANASSVLESTPLFATLSKMEIQAQGFISINAREITILDQAGCGMVPSWLLSPFPGESWQARGQSPGQPSASKDPTTARDDQRNDQQNVNKATERIRCDQS